MIRKALVDSALKLKAPLGIASIHAGLDRLCLRQSERDRYGSLSDVQRLQPVVDVERGPAQGHEADTQFSGQRRHERRL